MEVYFGGAYQGKLDYVLAVSKAKRVIDGAVCSVEEAENAQVLNHMHLLVKRYLKAGKNTEKLIDELYAYNKNIILICDEVGSGIVPIEREDRVYREAVGRLLCEAVKKSERVERIICGIGQCLKTSNI